MINRLFYGDNLEIIRQFLPNESIDLCYIDPPFHSNRSYYQIYNNFTTKPTAFSDSWKWDDIAEQGFLQILNNFPGKFTPQTIDLMAGLGKVLGKNSLFSYLVSITLRIAEIHRILKPNGSFYLHCDPTASHYLKIILDAVFCPLGGNFQNEIVWCYSVGGKSNVRFAKKHDIILFYTKNAENYTFNIQAASIPRKPDSHMKLRTDESGRYYQEKIDKKTGKIYQYYLDSGKIAEDYWTDIETLNRDDKQRLGYPTQKPEALLERIIKVSSNPGDIILDAYGGAGTTLAVAQRLNRQWIGIDITYQSISITLNRLQTTFGKNITSQIELQGVPTDIKSAIELFKQPNQQPAQEFEKWAILTYCHHQCSLIQHRTKGNKSIYGLAFLPKLTEPNKIIIQAKFELIKIEDLEKMQAIAHQENAIIGIIITLDIPSDLVIKSAKQDKIYQPQQPEKEPAKIQIITLEQMLEKNQRIDNLDVDLAEY